MKVHTTMVTAWNAAKKGHTIFGSTVAGPHYISTPSWRLGSIDSSNGTRCVFTSMIGYVQSNNRNTTTRRIALYQKNLGYLAILPEVLIGTQSWNELMQLSFMYGEKKGGKTYTSSFAKRGPIPTT